MGLDKVKRPLLEVEGSYAVPALSTAASTALGSRGVLGIISTEAAAPVVYTLRAPDRAGQRFEVVALQVQSSSDAPLHLNTGSASVGLSAATTAGTAADMITLSTNGAAATLVARNTTEWMITAVRGATVSTST